MTTSAVTPVEAPPALRDDLMVVPWKNQGGVSYLVENPARDTVFELGEREYFLCQQLDGETASVEIRRRYEARFGVPLAARDLEAFLLQIDHQGLLRTTSGPRVPTLPELFDIERFFPLPVVPLMRGDRLFGWFARRTRWCFTRLAHGLATAMIALAVILLFTAWSELMAALSANRTIEFLLLCFVCTSVVPSLRMLAHGIVCKRYGAQVPEVGIIFFYYVSPSLYCDWSGIGWMREGPRRFWTIFSGIYAQAVLFAVGTIGWCLSDPSGLPSEVWLALLVATSTGLLTAVANPLFKLEGYLLLANWLKAPRLMERALATLGAWIGGTPWPEPGSSRERRWLLLYGLGV